MNSDSSIVSRSFRHPIFVLNGFLMFVVVEEMNNHLKLAKLMAKKMF